MSLCTLLSLRGDFLTVTAFQRILCTELLQRLMEFQPALARAVALAAEVDCLVSMAQVAQDFNYCRPVLTQDNVLHIKQGVPFACFDARCNINFKSTCLALAVCCFSGEDSSVTCPVRRPHTDLVT